jgi:hypothetical protein
VGSYAISIASFGSILLGCLCGYGTDQCSFSLDFFARGLPVLPVEAIRRVDALRRVGGLVGYAILNACFGSYRGR